MCDGVGYGHLREFMLNLHQLRAVRHHGELWLSETGGAAGIMGLGMASGMMGGMGSLQQPVAPVAPAAPAAEDPIAKLKKAKEMLDLGLITQLDYDAVKAKALGL